MHTRKRGREQGHGAEFVSGIYVKLAQIFFWNWFGILLILPCYADNPPTLIVMIELQAIDPTSELVWIFCVHSFFVGAEDLSDAPIGLHFP